MEKETVFKLRSSILDKLYKFDEITHNTTKYDSVIVIDEDNMSNIITKKIIETVELCKTLTIFENKTEGLQYLSSIKTPPSLIFLDVHVINILETYQYDCEKTKIIILSTIPVIIDQYKNVECLEKPLSISAIQQYFKS